MILMVLLNNVIRALCDTRLIHHILMYHVLLGNVRTGLTRTSN